MEWKELERLAQEVIDQTLETLPGEIQGYAERIPLSLEEIPSDSIQEEGLPADILGLFVGESLQDAGLSDAPMPGQILLFLRNIWDFADEDPEQYQDEVRVTWLHELGHYFGWNEADLFDRDLD